MVSKSESITRVLVKVPQVYYPSIKKAHEDPNLETYTYRMDSTIPAPYFSWAEYAIQEYAPPLEGRIPALAVVASNCGPKNERNQLMQVD